MSKIPSLCLWNDYERVFHFLSQKLMAQTDRRWLGASDTCHHTGREPTWTTAAQFLMSPWVALKDKWTNCDPEATNIPLICLKHTAGQQRADSKQCSNAYSSNNQVLRKKRLIFTANGPPMSPSLTSSLDVTVWTFTVAFNISNQETTPSFS